MSMQQALTVVGTVVGAYFGYPQLGFVVGSLVGAALTPAQKVEGPRIEDQKVTLSTEGAGIPRVWGTVRLGGNVVESTDKIEVSDTESQGKGGGVKTTSYSYYVNMRTLLCEAKENEEVAIQRVWKDGKLIYDASSGASISSALASSENPAASLILYQGNEDQLPDPTEEARYGIGNASAYRGFVTIVMNGVDCPGGRVPQFSYELTIGAALSANIGIGQAFQPGGERRSFSKVNNGSDPTYLFVESQYVVPGELFTRKRIDIYALGLSYATNAFVARPTNTRGNFFALDASADIDAVCYRKIDDLGLDTGINVVVGMDGVSKEFACESIAYGQSNSRWTKFDNRFAICGDHNQASDVVELFDWDSRARLGVRNVYAQNLQIDNNHAWILVQTAGIETWEICDLETLDYVNATVLPAELLAYSERSYCTDEVGLICFARDESSASVWRIAYESGEFVFRQLISQSVSGVPLSSDKYTFGYINNVITGIDYPDGEDVALYGLAFDRLLASPVSVAQIIRDECADAGLSDSQVEVSTLVEQVAGFTITNPSSARAGIQPLMTAFAIDATDEDEQIKFFWRADRTSIATVAYDELGCVEDGSEPGDPMPLTRANVTELARSVTVSYINREFDYQTSTEEARRQVSEATADQNVELAISMDSDQAATAAHRILYDAHNERNRRSMKLSRKYACYSAGDVLTVEYPRGTLSDWRLVQVTDTGALIEAEAVPADAELYTQTAIGGTGYAGQEVAPLASPLRQVLLDIPLLRDQDNNAGIYDAIDSFASVRAEGELFVGDDDASLESRGTVSASAPIGLAETVPGAWNVNLIDDLNLFTVNIGDDEISSITRDQLLGGTENVWALGAPGRWEIGKSRTSNSLGAGRYTLSSNLRGLFGTEQYTGAHVAGDTFVLLRPVGMLRPNMSVGELGQEKKYRVIAKGRSLESASSQTYANTGEGLRPLSPVNLRRAVDSRDLSVDRRSRLSMNNLTGVLPLGESSEAYQWEFFASGSYDVVIGTAETTTSTITVAQQIAISVDPDVTAYVRVRQISDSVGPGHELQASA